MATVNKFFSPSFQLNFSLPGKLKQISVGTTSIWGVNSADMIYEMQNISFDLQGNISFKWQNISGRLKYLSVHKGIIWGVNKNDEIFFRKKSSSGSLNLKLNQTI